MNSVPVPFKTRIAATLIRWTINALSWTYRVDYVCGKDHAQNFSSGRQPMVVALWHDRLFFLAAHFKSRFLDAGVDLTVFTSRSRDGELGAQIVQAWGARAVRGSTSRGGLEGLRAMHRVITREHSSPVITPDGPRGPRHTAKSGTVVLAQISEVPILSTAYAATRCWNLRSWDRLIIPKPFSKVWVAVGEPFVVPRDLDNVGIERYRLRLEQVLTELVGRAEERARIG